MARMSGATWRPIPHNYTPGGQSAVQGVVIHIMAGTLSGTDNWFRNASAQASSHFGTSKSGALYQWVDTGDRAWAQADGNRAWLSIENEGQGGDALTDAQMDRCADVLRWAHEKYGVPLQVASSPAGRGLGYHAMGGSSWGGHTSCPGPRIVAQLGEIVKRAGGKSSGEGSTIPAGPVRYQVTINGQKYGYGAKGAQVTAVGKALVAKGYGKYYKEGPGPNWTDADTLNYAAFQKSLGFSGADADGVPGASSLAKLLGKATTPSKPVVDLSNVIAAARRDPGLKQGGTTHPADVKLVEAALKAEGLLSAKYAADGSYGSTTVTAYAKYQRKLGYSGRDADGIPGMASLSKLGSAHGFGVKA